VNKAKTRAQREGRSIPFASLERDEPAVDPERFRERGETYPGHWRSSPSNWGTAPEIVTQDRETLRVAMRAIAELPPAQQTVIRMRDLEGSSSEEVCTVLDISAANQRVLLHRARSRVRSALEGHLDA
jgi:RNA polymerase sigma-70 factor (ECF subfamily)